MAFLVAMTFSSCFKSKMEGKPKIVDGGIVSFEIQELLVGCIYVINLDTREDGRWIKTEAIFVDKETFHLCYEMMNKSPQNQFARFKMDNSEKYYVFNEWASMKKAGTPSVYVFNSDQKIITN